MTNPRGNIEIAGEDLGQARAKIQAAEAALLPLLQAPDGDMASIGQAVARLARMAAEVERIEGLIAGQTVGVGKPAP